MKKLLIVLTIINLAIIMPQKANAMTFSDALTFPLKIVTKPLKWAFYGYSRKVDDYKIEVKYELEVYGKPLTLKKAIRCDIYEGKVKSPIDGIKYPKRKAYKSTSNIYHYLDNNEILILPVPIICKVDKAYTAKTWKVPRNAWRRGYTKAEITKIPNKTKSFEPLKKDYIPSITIVKDKDNVKFIERIISPKYYQRKDADIKFKSITLKEGSNLEPEKDNRRFSWISGISKRNPAAHLKKDRGLYTAFGVFKFPKEIWSKIPKINDFITKIEKSNPDKKFFAISRNLTEVEGVDLGEVFEEIKEVGMIRRHDQESLNSFIDFYGINLNTKVGYKGHKLNNGAYRVNHVIKDYNYRNYYHPFTFDEKENVWAKSKKNIVGKLKIQRIKNLDLIKLVTQVILKGGQYRWEARFRISNEVFVKNQETGIIIFYDVKTKELIYPNVNLAEKLK